MSKCTEEHCDREGNRILNGHRYCGVCYEIQNDSLKALRVHLTAKRTMELVNEHSVKEISYEQAVDLLKVVAIEQVAANSAR